MTKTWPSEISWLQTWIILWAAHQQRVKTLNCGEEVGIKLPSNSLTASLNGQNTTYKILRTENINCGIYFQPKVDSEEEAI
jgi:hypothetical protein